MSWGTPFLAAIGERALRPVFVLERVEVYQEPGSSWRVASVSGYASSPATLDPISVELVGQSVAVRSWTSVYGGFSVTVVGELRDITAGVTKGSVLALRMGFSGLPESDWERIALGQLRNIRLVHPSQAAAKAWRLEMVDLATALRSRLVTTQGSQRLLFGTRTTTTTTADWTVGDTSLEVSSTSGFGRRTGAAGGLVVTVGSDSFLLTYLGTSTGPTRFTSVSDDVLNTTPVDAPLGSTVTEVAWLEGHPVDIARRVLTSRGDGSNGLYDVYPEAWGLGVHDSLVDHDDCDRHKEATELATGTHNWQLVEDQAVEDPGAWLSGHLARSGFFLAMRQGAVTVRAAQRTLGVTRTWLSGIEVTDDEIESLDAYDAWAPEADLEYAGVQVTTASEVDGEFFGDADLQTIPGAGYWLVDLSDRVLTDEAAHRDEAGERLYEAVTTVPERFVLTCAGLRAMQLAPGDVVRLRSSRLPSRAGNAGVDQHAWVASVKPSPARARVQVTVLCYPRTEEIYG